jgi:tetratricopeptide (TPR) repeat protein
MQKALSQLCLAIPVVCCAVLAEPTALLAAPAAAATLVPAGPASRADAGGPAATSAAPLATTLFDQELRERQARFAKEAALSQSPAAVIPLLGLAELWESVDDRAALQQLVAQTSKPRPTLAPLVQAHARWAEQKLLGHRGQPSEAKAIGRELGLITTFAVTGPFDNDGHRGHAAVYAPESEASAPAADSHYEGKNPSVPLRWRVLPETALSRDGSVPLDAWLRPDSQGTAYALCYIRSPQAQRVAVRVGSTGAVKVWVNRGAPVLDRELYHPLHPDQEVGGAMLLAGWNRLLVKISNNEGRWAFVLRLTTPDGRPLTGLATSAAPPSPDWPIPAAAAYTGAPPSNLLTLLRARVPKLAAGTRLVPGSAAARSRAEALLDLGLYLHYITPFDPETREDEQVVGEAVALWPSRRAYRLLALVTGEVNRERSSVEAGLALPGDGEPDERARLLYELGRIYDEGQRQRQAEQAYAEAARLRSALYPATLALAQLQAHRGVTSEAIRLVSGLHERHRALRVQRTLADLLGRAGRHAESEALYTALLAQSQDDQDAMRQLLSRARARGDVDAALGWLSKLEALAPEAVWVVRERIELLEGAGRHELALAAASAAMTQLGGDADWHQLRGRLLVALGRTELAISEYQTALAIKPQNPSLRSYLQHLDPQARSGDDLARSFRLDLPALLARPRPKPAAGDPARVLLDQKVTRVHKNGLSEVYTQRAIEILDEHGAAEYGEIDIRYTPDTQSVQIKSAKLYRRTGEVQESVAQQENNVSEPWYGLYYDVHAQTVRFDGLRPGDVVTLEYVLADVGRRNLLSDYFGDLHFMQEEVPRLDSRYILVLPEEELQRRPLYFNEPRRDGGVSIVRKDERRGPDHLIAFTATNVPRILSEPGMPGFTEVAAYVHVSTYRTWEDVAHWYTGLVAEQLAPSNDIIQAARAAVAGLAAGDELGKLRAIYNEVVRRTRYVGLEFGIHGYKPYKVAQIFQRKFGDCKDKASLLKVMLKEVGIDSTLVLARTRRNGHIDPEPASLSVFDHAIVYVPKFDLYLDGTAEFSGATELPTQDQDIMVLLVSDPRPPYNGKGHLTRTPVLPATSSVVARRFAVQLEPGGSARVADELRITGQSAERWREHFQTPGSQKERYEKSWNEVYPGAKALRVALPGITDRDQPVMLSGEVEVPKWGRPQGGAGSESTRGASADLVLRPLGRDPDLLRSFARLSQRRYDLILGFPWSNQEEVTVRLPASLTVRRLPAARHLESPFGQFDLTAEQRRTAAGTEVVVKAALRIDRHRIAAGEYAAFRSFCSAVDSAVAQELVVGRE